MNEYQEALKEIKKCSCENCYCDNMRAVEELVDRATPMKILNKVDENGEPCLPRNHGLCPICNSLVKLTDKYCHECGQAINRSEEE